MSRFVSTKEWLKGWTWILLAAEITHLPWRAVPGEFFEKNL
jgi:hypothetical protein